MPFDNRSPFGDPSISPPTSKSVLPTNNVPTILDILNGGISIQDVYPHARGDWASGDDVDKSYREKGDDYKRLERDFDILQQMTGSIPPPQEQWKVKVPGGSRVFPSFAEAQKYKEKLKEKGVFYAYLTRIAQSNSDQNDRVTLIADSLSKTLMVESIDATRGVKEAGATFCVYSNYFITCAHVVKKYDKYRASKDVDLSSGVIVNLVQGGNRYRAIVVATDPLLDIALLKSDLSVPFFQLDDAFSVGDDIVAIGSPHGYENNVSVGNVSSLDRKVYNYQGAPLYSFVDLAIFPGNSGGPVIKESNGKVIGMITLIVSAEGGYGLNASLPSKYIMSFCESNIKNFRIEKNKK